VTILEGTQICALVTIDNLSSSKRLTADNSSNEALPGKRKLRRSKKFFNDYLAKLRHQLRELPGL
jgi:hypothetical protein